MTSYRGALGEFVDETVIRKSRFITRVIGIADEDAAIAEIAAVRKLHSDATHNCYAYIADAQGLVQRFSDDGEPSGTAGLPMLEVLRKHKMGKTLAIVTRYFGGIKLGASGLVGAYSGCVADALGKAQIKTFELSDLGEIVCPYPLIDQVARAIAASGGEQCGASYGESVSARFAIPVSKRAALDAAIAPLTAKNVRLTYTGTEFFGYENTTS